MKYLKILILLFALTSCEHFEPTVQDPDLLIYAQRIQSELADRGLYFEIDFDLLKVENLREDHNAFGLSYPNDRIEIDAETYTLITTKFQTDVRLEALMLHEIGHQAFNLNHYEGDDKPFYIMKTSTWQTVNTDNVDEMYDNFVKYYNN